MGQYIVQRIALMVPTLIGLTAVIFFALRVLVPTDAIDLAYDTDDIPDPERMQQLREEFGLSGPLPMQYLKWLGGVATGDLGISISSGRPVTEELYRRVPTSLQLGMGALVITMVIAIPVGLVSAARQDSWIDYLARGSAILFYAVPHFWIAILVVVFASVWFSWAPSTQYRSFFEDPIANLNHVWLPMVILGLNATGTMIRLTRTQVLEVVKADYVRTARAKGLKSNAIYSRHVLRNSLLPIITIVGLQISNIVAGTVIFEQIFMVPGVGRYLLQALQQLDIFVILGVNLFLGLVLVFSNLIVDIIYGIVDPRIRLS